MLVTDTALISSIPQHEGCGLHDKQHSTLFAFCPAASDTREALQPQPHRTPAQPNWTSSPHLGIGLCQSSPLPGKGTWIPTGVFLLPVHPGDGVVAVCILVIAILNGVGGAGAVCGGSRGQLGLLHLVFPQGCSEQRACKLGQSKAHPPRASQHWSPHGSNLSPITPFPVEPGQTTHCNNSAAGWEGSGAGTMPVGAATFPSPGGAVMPGQGMPALPGGQAGGGMQQAACGAPPTLLPP